MIKGALYCRESDDDTNKAPPVENQIERGKQWAKEKGIEIVKVYVDNGYSGGDWNRPDWIQSLNDAKRHLYSVLWTWDKDRLARDTEQFLYFYRNMKNAGARIWEDTANDYINMETLGDRVKHQTMAQAAEIFRLVTSEKVKQAYRRKMKEGKSWGRPEIKFNVEEARRLRSIGMGWRAIGSELKVNYNTIRRRLQKRVIVEHPEKADASPLNGDRGIL